MIACQIFALAKHNRKTQTINTRKGFPIYGTWHCTCDWGSVLGISRWCGACCWQTFAHATAIMHRDYKRLRLVLVLQLLSSVLQYSNIRTAAAEMSNQVSEQGCCVPSVVCHGLYLSEYRSPTCPVHQERVYISCIKELQAASKTQCTICHRPLQLGQVGSMDVH